MKDIKKQIIEYVKETRSEVKKVTWPDQKYITTATIVILVIIFVVAIVTGLIDWALARAILFLTKAF